MRGVVSLIIAILALGLAQAQRPFIEYMGEVPGMATYDLFTNPDSTLSFVGWDNFTGSTVISKVDTNGNVIWQQKNPNGCGSRYMSGMPSKNGGYYVLQVRYDCWEEIYLNFLSGSGQIKKSIKLANEEYLSGASNFQFYMKETDDVLYIVNSGEGDNVIERINLNDSTKIDEKILTGIEDISFSRTPYETDESWTFMYWGANLCVLDTSGTYKNYQFLSTLDQYSITSLLPNPVHDGKLLAYGYEKLDDPNSSSKQRRPRVFVLDTSDLSFEVINLVNITDQDNRYNYRIMDCVSFGDMSLITMNYVINGSGDQYNVYTLFDSQTMEVFYEESVLNETGYDISPIHLTRVGQSAYSTDGPSRIQKITPKNAPLSIEKIASKSELDVYPNPSRGNFNFELRGNSTIQGIQVFSLNGNLVREITPATNRFTVNLEQAGVYLMKIVTKNKVYNRKVIKL